MLLDSSVITAGVRKPYPHGLIGIDEAIEAAAALRAGEPLIRPAPPVGDTPAQVEARVDAIVAGGLMQRRSPSGPARHEAGHAVAAVVLGVPFVSVKIYSDGSGSTDFGVVVPGASAANQMVRRMAVTAAGLVAEADYERLDSWIDRPQFATDRETLGRIAAMFSEAFPELAYRDPLSLARVVVQSPAPRRAVDLVARALEHSGTLSADLVAGYVATAFRLAGVPAVFPAADLADFCEPSMRIHSDHSERVGERESWAFRWIAKSESPGLVLVERCDVGYPFL